MSVTQLDNEDNMTNDWIGRKEIACFLEETTNKTKHQFPAFNSHLPH